MASYGHVPTLDEAKAAFTPVFILMNASRRMLILASAPIHAVFWFFCNVISPHKQGSFDFSRTRLTLFRDLPVAMPHRTIEAWQRSLALPNNAGK
jgi:hypothetical protein